MAAAIKRSYTGSTELQELQGYRATGLQSYRATELQGYRATGLQSYRATGLQSYRATGLQGYRATDLQSYSATELQELYRIYRATELQGYRATGLQSYRSTELQGYRNTELQELYRIYRATGATGLQSYRSTELQGYRLQGYRATGLQGYRATGLQLVLQSYRATVLQGYRATGYRATELQDLQYYRSSYRATGSTVLQGYRATGSTELQELQELHCYGSYRIYRATRAYRATELQGYRATVLQSYRIYRATELQCYRSYRIYRATGLQSYRSYSATGLQGYRATGATELQSCRSTELKELQGYRATGLQSYRATELQCYRSYRATELQSVTMEDLAKRKKMRAGHRGSATKLVTKIVQKLEGETDEEVDKNWLIQSKLTLEGKIESLKALDGQILELISDLDGESVEQDIEKEIDEADNINAELHKHRVNEILKLTSKKDWGHCPGESNPADLGSRGVIATKLKQSQIWWEGPSWLAGTLTDWPATTVTNKTLETSEEEKKSTVLIVNVEKPVGIKEVVSIERYGGLRKLIRVTAWVKRFVYNLQAATMGRAKRSGEIAVVEGIEAEKEWILAAQAELKKDNKFSQLVSSLGLQDMGGMLRCRGRLENAELAFSARNPIILPRDHVLTEMIVRDCHQRVCHSGVRSTLAELRARYWVPKGRQMVKKILVEIEGTLNARPLTYEYEELEEEVLTPSHLIYGRRITSIPDEIVEDREEMSGKESQGKSFLPEVAKREMSRAGLNNAGKKFHPAVGTTSEETDQSLMDYYRRFLGPVENQPDEEIQEDIETEFLEVVTSSPQVCSEEEDVDSSKTNEEPQEKPKPADHYLMSVEPVDSSDTNEEPKEKPKPAARHCTMSVEKEKPPKQELCI
ncbi:hypothetical protein QZH41_000860, partial [Actinostola sp. cb2023]